MSLTPSGRVMLPLSNARNMLADCSTFQSLMGVSTVAEAKAKTYYLQTDEVVDGNESTEAALPRAVVSYSAGSFQGELRSTSGWTFSGPVWLEIEVDVPAEYLDSYQQSLIWFGNKLGDLISDLMTRGTPGNGSDFLSIRTLHLEAWGRRPAEESSWNRETLAALMSFEWIGC